MSDPSCHQIPTDKEFNILAWQTIAIAGGYFLLLIYVFYSMWKYMISGEGKKPPALVMFYSSSLA